LISHPKLFGKEGGLSELLKNEGKVMSKTFLETTTQIQSVSTSRMKKSGRSRPIKEEWRPKWLHPSSTDEREYFEELFSFNNLIWAHNKARKNKSQRIEIRRFEKDLYRNIEQIRSNVLNNTVSFGPYKTFILFDQKKREVTTTKFQDRIIHWILYEYFSRLFEPSFIYDTYGNRKNKGALRGALRVQQFMRSTKNEYILKIDFSKYYFSIIHSKMLAAIKTKESNPQILLLFNMLLKSYKTLDGFDHLFPPSSIYRNTYEKGMPIGSLVSQLCANIYLISLDRMIKNTMGTKQYVRYVDDLVIFGRDKPELREKLKSIEDFIGRHLGLWLNPRKTSIHNKSRGIDFLGYRLTKHKKLPRKTTQQKIRKAISAEDVLYLNGLRGVYIHTDSHLVRIAENTLNTDIRNSVNNTANIKIVA